MVRSAETREMLRARSKKFAKPDILLAAGKVRALPNGMKTFSTPALYHPLVNITCIPSDSISGVIQHAR